ncbi:HNH endonuclease [Cellulomonas uda]|uniref:HNH nuclease domain-containing protein n=2 Tax=Cellulomonas uda TaxID=1714 RepID=A0A4Y3KEQ6_CELUD|nr:hypothetical protein CUD01_18440 [Cellulomonas uda]
MTRTWSGSKSRNARRTIRARGRFQHCWRCGRDLDLDEDTWHAGHLTDRMDGGTDNPHNLAAECPPCNTRAGGLRGSAITNARHEAPNWPTSREQKIRPRW